MLEADGARLTQPLDVTPDPRLKLAPEAYARQFALARRIEEAQARVTVAARENGALLAALAERRKGGEARRDGHGDRRVSASAPRISPAARPGGCR